MLQKQQIIHIVSEVVVLLGVIIYFQSKHNKTEKRLTELENIVREQHLYITNQQKVLNNLLNKERSTESDDNTINEPYSQNGVEISMAPQNTAAPKNNARRPLNKDKRDSKKNKDDTSRIRKSKEKTQKECSVSQDLQQNPEATDDSNIPNENEMNLESLISETSSYMNSKNKPPLNKGKVEELDTSSESISDIEISIHESELDRELETEYANMD